MSTPDIREEDLTSEDEVMIMASDGLWDVISNQEAINIIKDTPVCLSSEGTSSIMCWRAMVTVALRAPHPGEGAMLLEGGICDQARVASRHELGSSSCMSAVPRLVDCCVA